MPQSNRSVGEFDLRTDMNHYYRHSVCTYNDPKLGPVAAWISEFTGDNNELNAAIKVLLPDAKDYSAMMRVPVEALDFTLPPLGLVKIDEDWWLPTRSPQRRMRKGFNSECIQLAMLEAGNYTGDSDAHIERKDVVKQIWYGCPDRIALHLVVWGKSIYYMTDKVATIDDTGAVTLIPNKEKLGELSCKILANNWDTVLSKTSVRILPSSLLTPLA